MISNKIKKIDIIDESILNHFIRISNSMTLKSGFNYLFMCMDGVLFF